MPRYLLGFFLWNVDNLYCEHLRTLRASSSLGPAAAVATQLHGWWHIMAGYATYIQITSVIHHRRRYLGRPVSYAWGPVGLCLAEAEKAKEV